MTDSAKARCDVKHKVRRSDNLGEILPHSLPLTPSISYPPRSSSMSSGQITILQRSHWRRVRSLRANPSAPLEPDQRRLSTRTVRRA